MAETTYADTRTGWREGWGRTILVGVMAGVVGAIVMGVFAMVAAATYQGTGFFTPLYHIASPVVGGDPMMRSMDAAAGGDVFTLEIGAALLGAAIHMMWGAFWGVVFFALAHALRLLNTAALIATGAVFGLVVMMFMSLITLPITSATLGGGRPIEEMPSMVGWGTFSVEHALYGLTLGAWAAARRPAAERVEVPVEEEPPLAA